MSAGLQVWNDSSYLQVDGQNQHICLLRTGTVTTTALNNSRTDVACSAFTIPVNPGEVAAISGPGQFTVAGKYQGSWQCHAYNASAGSTYSYWIFGPYVPSGTNVGMEIYNDQGALIWDTGRLPIRVVGEISGQGAFTVGSAGRQYALYPTQAYARIVRSLTGDPAGNGNVSLVVQMYGGFGGISGQSLTSLETDYLVSVRVGVSSNQIPIGWVTDYSNNLDNKFTVIDVTGY